MTKVRKWQVKQTALGADGFTIIHEVGDQLDEDPGTSVVTDVVEVDVEVTFPGGRGKTDEEPKTEPVAAKPKTGPAARPHTGGKAQ